MLNRFFFVTSSAVASIDVRGSERGEVSFRCSHTYAWSNSKYLCKDPCKSDSDTLVWVQAGQKAESGRISLADLGNGVSVVNISRLQLSDSGLYWCGVNRALGDTFIDVHLTVNKGMLNSPVIGNLVVLPSNGLLLIFGLITICINVFTPLHKMLFSYWSDRLFVRSPSVVQLFAPPVCIQTDTDAPQQRVKRCRVRLGRTKTRPV